MYRFMSAIESFRKIASENKTLLCFGIDPDLYRIQGYSTSSGQTIEQSISHYFHSIIDSLLEENAISALKPNYAYFAQYGFDGLFVLKELMQRYKNRVPIIFDGKRGDIGKTCEAYSKEMYDFWDADAVTISPYMGQDSIAPFLREDRLVYVLCKTSNPSSKEFQELVHKERSIYNFLLIQRSFVFTVLRFLLSTISPNTTMKCA